VTIAHFWREQNSPWRDVRIGRRTAWTLLLSASVAALFAREASAGCIANNLGKVGMGVAIAAIGVIIIPAVAATTFGVLVFVAVAATSLAGAHYIAKGVTGLMRCPWTL
jgi:uncharacterized membrane protein YoaT (DUF817 family)